MLAVADSDSNVKWAAATLDVVAASGSDVDGRLVVLDSPLRPTPAQVAAAVVGTGADRAGGGPHVVTRRALRRVLAQGAVDVLLVACTGPAARVVIADALAAPWRPAVVTGMPGLAWPASSEAVRLRAGADAFVVHSPQEREAHAPLLGQWSPTTRAVLGHLPFLARADAAVPGSAVTDRSGRPRLVFAAQALVPAERADRLRVLRALDAVAEAGVDVVLKLRGRAGDRQTHDERWPYDALVADLGLRLGARPGGGSLTVDHGPMAAHLRPGTLLVTVSSTAALEAMAAGVPVALIDDLGVGPELINEVFVGSGRFVALADLPCALDAAARDPLAAAPDPAWAARTYLHHEPSEVAGAVLGLARDAAARRLPRPPGPGARDRLGHLRARVRLADPTVRIARVARRPRASAR